MTCYIANIDAEYSMSRYVNAKLAKINK